MNAETLVIGDSQMKYIAKYFIKSHLKVTVSSISGRKINGIAEEEIMSSVRFKNIILSIGTNNMPNQRPSISFLEYEKLIQKIRSLNTRSSIFICTVLPRSCNMYKKYTTNSWIKEEGRINLLNSKISVFNGQLEELALR